MMFKSDVYVKYHIITADFKSVEKVFLRQGVPKDDIDQVFKNFKAAKDANKIKDLQEKNIDTWAKKPFEDFKKFVDKIASEKSKTQHKAITKSEGAKLVAENSDWRVYNILEHKACMEYGSNTKWCITEEDGKQWASYIAHMNFYFFISKTRDRNDPLAKIAMNIDAKGKKEYWNAHDKKIKEPAGLPEFKPEHATEVVIINGKKITIEQLSKMENLEIKGDLDLGHTQIKELPQGLTVGGDLDLRDTQIKELPQGLTVGGYLDLEGTQIKELPQGLTVGGGLYLGGTQIKELPQGLTVGGGLYLGDTQIKELPQGLTVGGDLYLERTPIKELPQGLTVGGSLDLYGTQIKELPQGLKVKDVIYVTDKSKIKCSAELREKLS
jgi:hypothetical protein